MSNETPELSSRIPSGEPSKLQDLVSRFSAALLAKLEAAEKKYGHDNAWLKDDWESDCQKALLRHIEKGDPRDVAAYCAFMWHHGWSTKVPVPSGELGELLKERSFSDKWNAMVGALVLVSTKISADVNSDGFNRTEWIAIKNIIERSLEGQQRELADALARLGEK
jgi:hypothetical protein